MSKDLGNRPHRTLWTVSEGRLEEAEGYVCHGYDPPFYWFPQLGEPGWGVSMGLGSGCFETREEAAAKAQEELQKQSNELERNLAALSVESGGRDATDRR